MNISRQPNSAVLAHTPMHRSDSIEFRPGRMVTAGCVLRMRIQMGEHELDLRTLAQSKTVDVLRMDVSFVAASGNASMESGA